MAEMITYRAYQPGDESAIVSLYEECYNEPLGLAGWRWTYLDSPIERIDVNLAFDGHRLVGHSAGGPAELAMGSDRVAASRTQNIMVHPDYRRQRIVTSSLECLAAANRQQGVDLWFSFPVRPASLRVLTETCDFSPVAELYAHQCPLSKLAADSAQEVQVDRACFGEADVEFLRHHMPVGRWHVPRTLAHLRWRYESHPRNRYRVARLARSGKPGGLCVFKVFEPDRSADLVELACEAAELPVLLAGVAASVRSRAEKLMTWTSPHYPLHRGLLEMGFQPGDPLTTVVFRPLSARGDEIANRWENWYLTMGDSDVY